MGNATRALGVSCERWRSLKLIGRFERYEIGQAAVNFGIYCPDFGAEARLQLRPKLGCCLAGRPGSTAGTHTFRLF